MEQSYTQQNSNIATNVMMVQDMNNNQRMGSEASFDYQNNNSQMPMRRQPTDNFEINQEELDYNLSMFKPKDEDVTNI